MSQPVRKIAALGLVADVPLPLGAVVGAAGPPKCECGSANCVVRSVRHLKFLIRHSPRRLHALLEMRDQIGGDERDAFRIAHQRLQRGPFAFQVDAVAAPRLMHPSGCASLRLSRGIPCRSALLLRQLLAFGDFLELRVELRQRGGVQREPGINRDSISRPRSFLARPSLGKSTNV